MSFISAPIDANRFAEAITNLPLANLHLKGAEIRNSIAHLRSSNQQLQSYAADGDSDCKDAIEENVLVLQRMEGRIQLLKQEVENRGFKWGEDESVKRSPKLRGNRILSNGSETVTSQPSSTERAMVSNRGRFGDPGPITRPRERREEEGDVNEDGIHL